jgi:drug/metabolite transporter (DMT)-like permease
MQSGTYCHNIDPEHNLNSLRNWLASVPSKQSPASGIALRLLSGTCFVVLAALVKDLASRYAISEIMFFRSACAIPPLLIYSCLIGRGRRDIIIRRPFAHLRRAIVGGGSMVLTFYAYATLPIVTAQSLIFLAPIISVGIAPLFGEHVCRWRVLSAAAGFVGVVLMIGAPMNMFGPADAEVSKMLGIACGLGSAALTAVSLMAIRDLSKTETPNSIALCFVVFCAMATLATLPLGWRLPGLIDFGLLCACGLVGAAGHLLLTTALARAEVSLLAPFEYFSILTTVLIGSVYFGEWPTTPELIGISLIVVGGSVAISRHVLSGPPEASA